MKRLLSLIALSILIAASYGQTNPTAAEREQQRSKQQSGK